MQDVRLAGRALTLGTFGLPRLWGTAFGAGLLPLPSNFSELRSAAPAPSSAVPWSSASTSASAKENRLPQFSVVYHGNRYIMSGLRGCVILGWSNNTDIFVYQCGMDVCV